MDIMDHIQTAALWWSFGALCGGLFTFFVLRPLLGYTHRSHS